MSKCCWLCTNKNKQKTVKNNQSEDKYKGNMVEIAHAASWLSGRARSYMDEVMGLIRQTSNSCPFCLVFCQAVPTRQQ